MALQTYVCQSHDFSTTAISSYNCLVSLKACAANSGLFPVMQVKRVPELVLAAITAQLLPGLLHLHRRSHMVCGLVHQQRILRMICVCGLLSADSYVHFLPYHTPHTMRCTCGPPNDAPDWLIHICLLYLPSCLQLRLQMHAEANRVFIVMLGAQRHQASKCATEP